MGRVIYKNTRLIPTPYPQCCQKRTDGLIITGTKEIAMFKVGDKVSKVGGDYTHDGEVRAVFTKVNGEVRYVVENYFNKSLHIFSDKNLELRPLEFQKILDWCVNENITVYDADCKGKGYPSQRLDELLDSQGKDIYCSGLNYSFRLDDEHNKYIIETLELPLPTGCTKYCVGALNNGKYILGAY